MSSCVDTPERWPRSPTMPWLSKHWPLPARGSRSWTPSGRSEPAGRRRSLSRSGCRSRRGMDDEARSAGGVAEQDARGGDPPAARCPRGISPSVGRTPERPAGDAARGVGAASRRGRPCTSCRQPAAGARSRGRASARTPRGSATHRAGGARGVRVVEASAGDRGALAPDDAILHARRDECEGGLRGVAGPVGADGRIS